MTGIHENGRKQMDTPSLNLIGSYGRWASGFCERRPYSFLNEEWENLDDWKKEAKAKVLELIGSPQIEKKVRVSRLDHYQFDDLEIEELTWKLPYGPPTKAVFMKPIDAKGPLPGILALHDHGGIKYFGKSKIIHTSEPLHPFVQNHQDTYYGGVAWANEIARRGYGVLVHDVFPFESRKILPSELPAHVVHRMMTPPLDVREVDPEDLRPEQNTSEFDVSEGETVDDIKRYNAFGEQHEHIIARSLFCAGLTWPGMFLAEDTFALDQLCARPEIDASCIGCCGLSGGGLRTNYLSGIDERIKCSVTVGFMTTWADFTLNVSYTHTWMVYIPLVARYMDYPEILALRAPLPSLVLVTEKDPLYTLSEVKKAVSLLEKTYTKAGAEEQLRCAFYRGPHKFDLPMQDEAWEWLDRWLK
jgi:dienelactone hydrolase